MRAPEDILGPPSRPHLTGITPAVYGLVLPETRTMVGQLWAAHPDALYARAYDDRQDATHVLFLEAWRQWVGADVAGLADFGHRYVTNGSSEAIRESVWNLAQVALAARRSPCLHVFAGEYEGYAAYARAANVKVVIHDRARWDDSTAYAPDAIHRWYVSQPSAIDGNVWTDFAPFLAAMGERGIEVAVDLAYVGATANRCPIDVTAENVPHVFFSLSKVFGVFYHRIGGVFSRASLLGLDGNKWFKNMFSLYLGLSLIDATPSPTTLPARYAHLQAQACRILGAQHDIPMTPSQVLLLASSPLGPYPTAFRRGSGFRWCLTPTLDQLLRDAGDSAHA